MSEPCKKCGGTDFTAKGSCKACKRAINQAYRLKRAGGGNTVTTKAKSKAASAAVSAPAPENMLEIEQGYGIKAWIDDPYLMIEQKDHDGRADTICLSRSELRLVIGKFTEWAGRC